METRSNVAKAELLKSLFYKCFCHSSLPLSNSVPLDMESCSASILCTEKQSLETSKSTGLDGVSAYVLRQSTPHHALPNFLIYLSHRVRSPANGSVPAIFKSSLAEIYCPTDCEQAF